MLAAMFEPSFCSWEIRWVKRFKRSLNNGIPPERATLGLVGTSMGYQALDQWEQMALNISEK